MKKLIEALKHTPSTLIGLLLILAALFLLATDKITFDSFQDYIIEAVLVLFGLRSIAYAPKEQE